MLYFSGSLHEITKKTVSIFLCIGLIMGLGVGLKLTNAPFAIGLIASCLVLQTTVKNRLAFAMILGCGVLLGVAITGGFWFFKMWALFQNPFFPQFNNIFKSDLATYIGIVDARWGPKTVVEGLIWPFMFTLHPYLVGEGKIIQILWPFAYVVLIIYAFKYIVSFFSHSFFIKQKHKKLILFFMFFLVSYFIWLKVFAIGRYLVVLDILLPVLVYVGLRELINSYFIKKIIFATIVLGLMVAAIVNDGSARSGFFGSLLRVDVPKIQNPNSSVVVLAGSQPLAWMIPKFPSDLVFVSVGGGNLPVPQEYDGSFPASTGYDEKFNTVINNRNGDIFLLVGAFTEPQPDKLESSRFIAGLNWIMRVSGLSSNHICSGVSLLARNLFYSKRLDGKIVTYSRNVACQFVIHPLKIDFNYMNLQELYKAREKLSWYRLNFRDEDCILYKSFIGKRSIPYR